MASKRHKHGWELNSGLFEVYWKRRKSGKRMETYADKVRVGGTVFYFLDGYIEKAARLTKQAKKGQHGE